MSNLLVVRRPQRLSLLLKPDGKTPLLFFLPKTDRSELDELVRANLSRSGVTKETDVNNLIEQAEIQYERKVKTQETSREVRRLMQIRAKGGSLMQVGYRRWKQAFYPARQPTKQVLNLGN